jgi:hypothetical protein
MTDARIAFELAGAILILLWMFGLWLEWLDWQIPGPVDVDEWNDRT